MKKGWNKSLSIVLIMFMTVVVTGALVWATLRKSTVEGDTGTLPDGLISSAVITDRLAFGINDDGSYNYGIKEELALDTFLDSNGVHNLSDLEALANDSARITYITSNASSYITAIAGYLDVNRFSSAFNMVDYLNDYYDLGISKTKTVDGQVQTITDAEAILAAIQAVEQWEVEKKLNTQLVVEYTNLQQAIAYVKEEKLIDYTDAAKLIQNIQLDAIANYLVNRFGISYDNLVDIDKNLNAVNIYSTLTTNTTLITVGTTSISVPDATLKIIFGDGENIFSEDPAQDYSIASSISTNMLTQICAFAAKDTASSAYTARLNTALAATNISNVTSYIKTYISNFATSTTSDTFLYNYVGTYINLQKIFAYLEENLGTDLTYGPDIEDAYNILYDNAITLGLSTTALESWATNYSDYWTWTNKDLGKTTDSQGNTLLANKIPYNAVSDLITIINQYELDRLYTSGITASEKLDAQKNFIINYAQSLDATITDFQGAVNYLKSTTIITKFSTIAAYNSSDEESNATEIIGIIRTEDIQVSDAYIQVNGHDITTTSVYSEIIRQWISSQWTSDNTNFDFISSASNIQNATVNDMAYYIVNRDSDGNGDSSVAFYTDGVTTFKFNGIDCLIDQKSSDNYIKYVSEGDNNGDNNTVFRSNAVSDLKELYSALLDTENKTFNSADYSSNYNLIVTVNKYVNAKDALSDFSTIASYLNGYDNNFLVKTSTLSDVIAFISNIPLSEGQEYSNLDADGNGTTTVHEITDFLYTANNYAARINLVTKDLEDVQSYLNEKNSSTFLTTDTLLETLNKLHGNGLTLITSIGDANDYLIASDNVKGYEYFSEYHSQYEDAVLPLTQSDVMINIINTLESVSGANRNTISPYTSTDEDFLDNLKEFITSHYGFIFSEGSDDEYYPIEIFNLIQIAEEKGLSIGYSTATFQSLITTIGNSTPFNLSVTQENADYNDYREIIENYNSTSINDILTTKASSSESWTALQDWLKENGNMYIPGPIVIDSNENDNISGADITYDLQNIVTYLKAEGYDIEVLDENIGSATYGEQKPYDTIYKIITTLSAIEGEGTYSPSVKESFSNDETVMLNNAVADKKLNSIYTISGSAVTNGTHTYDINGSNQFTIGETTYTISGSTVIDEDNNTYQIVNSQFSFTNQTTIENIYLQFGQKYSNDTLNQLNNLYITSMDVSATLNGTAISVSSPMIQYSNNGDYGFYYAGNIYYSYYWYQYLDLNNIRTFGVNTIEGDLIPDASGYYEFTFSYTYTIANGGSVSSNGTSYGTQEYSISFYLSDEGVYYNSYPTFESSTVEEDSGSNSITSVYNYNQTEDATTLSIDPSLYSLTVSQIDTSLSSHAYTTTFTEEDNDTTFNGYFNIYRDGTLQTINCARTTIYYYQYTSDFTLLKSTTELTAQQMTDQSVTLFATVEYGTDSDTLVNRNNGDSGFRDATAGESATYTVTLYNENYFPGTGQKAFDHNSYFPEVEVQFTENGSYNFEVKYLLRYKPYSTSGFIYEAMSNSESLFATNFAKYYDEDGGLLSEGVTPSYLTDPYYNLYNFGVTSYFNKLDANSKKLELRDYTSDIRSDYSYVINNSTYMTSGSFTEAGLAEIKAILIANAEYTLKTLKINGATPTSSAYTTTINSCISIAEIYNYLYNTTTTVTNQTVLFAYVLDKANLLANTNMPTISFGYLGTYAFTSSTPKSTYTKYSSITSSVTRSFTKDTLISDLGLYIVNVVYKYSNYDGGSTELQQTFIFRISTGEPTVKIYTTDGTTQDITSDDTLTTNEYTNESVYLAWNDATYFQYEYWAQVSTSGDDYEWTANPTYTNYSTITQDDKVVGSLLSANGEYRVAIYYGSSSITNSSKTVKSFIIDKTPIDDVQTYVVSSQKQNSKYYIADTTDSTYLDSSFTISYPEKASGATITASYKKILLDSFTDYAEILGVVSEGGAISDASYVTTNYSLDVSKIATAPTTADFKYTGGSYSLSDSVNDNLVLDGSSSALYIFTITDAAGNTTQYFVLYDLTKAYVNIYEEPTNDYNIISADTTLFWGTYKAINLNYSNYSSLSDNNKAIVDAFMSSTFFTADEVSSNVRTLENTPLLDHAIPSATSSYADGYVSTGLEGKYIIIPNASASVSSVPTNDTETTISHNYNSSDLATTKSVTLLAQAGTTSADYTLFKGEQTYTFSVISGSHIAEIANGTTIAYEEKDDVYSNSLQMNFDNSLAIAYGSDTTTGTGNIGTTDDLNQLSQGVSYNAGQLIFSFLPNATYEVSTVKYYYYELDVIQSLLNDYTGSTLETRLTPLFPFVYNTNLVTLYDSTSPTTNQNASFSSTDLTRWFSNCINPEVVDGNKVTKDGMYVFERTYTSGSVPAESLDSEVYYYVYYVDKGEIISIDYLNSGEYPFDYANGYDISMILGTNPETQATFDAGDIDVLVQEGLSLFETNKLPVELNIPTDKYNSYNIIDQKIAELNETQPAGYADKIASLQALKAQIVARNEQLFSLTYSVQYSAAGSTDGYQAISLDSIQATSDGVNSCDFTNAGAYSITLSSGTANGKISTITYGNGDFTFDIVTEYPNGQFYGENSDDSTITFNKKDDSVNAFENTNTNVLYFSFSDKSQEYIADVDYRNLTISQDGTAIYTIANGTTTGNKAAYTFAPVNSNGEILTDLYTTVDGETRFYYTATDYYVVNADGYINMFDATGVIRDVPRKQLTDNNGATVLFTYRVCIFNEDSPSTAILSDTTSTAAIETKFEAKVQFEGNEDDYGDYFEQTYSIIVDRVKPQANLNNLVLNEINAIVSKLYSGYTVTYESGSYVIRDSELNVITNTSISALITEMTTALSNSENFDYSFYLDDEFIMYNSDEDKESSYLYYKYLGYDLASYTPTTTPDDTDDYTFSLTSGYWTTLTYSSTNELNLYTSISGSGEYSEGYYEIVEEDQAGNYRVYVVYLGSTIPTYAYTYWSYPVLEGGSTTENNGSLTGSVYTKSVNGEDLEVSIPGPTELDFWQYAKVTIKTFTTSETTLATAPTSTSLFYFAPSLTATDIDISDYTQQINDYIQSIISGTAQDGYLVTIHFYNRSTDKTYTLTYQKAGERLQITTNDINDDQFQVVFDSDTTNTKAQSITVQLYSQGNWVTKTKDDSTSNNPISTSTRTYTFSQGLYKFTVTDNYGRQTTLIYQINLSDVLAVQPKTTGSAYEKDGDNYYSSQNMAITFQSKLRNATITAVGYDSNNISFGATVNGVQELTLGNGTTLLNNVSVASVASGTLYNTAYYSESGLKELVLYNYNTSGNLSTEYSVIVFNVKLKYADLATENVKEIRIVYINALPEITVTDSDNNEVDGTKFLEDVTLSWPDIKIDDVTLPVSASIIRTYYDEDSTASQTQSYSADDSFTLTESGSYRVILESSLGNTKASSYTYVGGSISMYDINVVNGTTTTPLSASPQAGYITINGTQVEPVRTYFAQKDYFVEHDDTSLQAKYLSVIANADENLTVTELMSYYNDSLDYLDSSITSVEPDTTANTYKIYKIHGDNTSTVFAEYLIVYFVDSGSDFANVTMEDTQSEDALQTNFGNKYTNDEITISWDAYNGMSKNTVYCDCYYNNELIGTYYSTTTAEATLTLSNAGYYKLVFRDLANNEESFASSTLAYSYLSMYVVNDVIFNVNNADPIPNFITNDTVSIQVLNQELYTQNVVVTYLLNGVSQGTASAGTTGYLFSAAGYYEVTMTTTVTPTIGDPVTISTTYNFVIIDPDTALLCYDLPEAYGFTITSFVRGNEDITYQLDDLHSLWLSASDFGVGNYTVSLSYTNPSTNQTSIFSYEIWINDEIPSLVCSIDWGTSTTKTVYVYFNPKLIYEMIGNAQIEITGQGVYTIDENSLNEKVTLELTQNTTYTVKITSLDGRTISIYKVTKTEPLNTTAVIIIIVACVLVVGLTTVFIVIRTRIKFR